MGGNRSERGALEDVRRALSAGGRAGLGLFAIEGLRLHERALASGKAVVTAVAARSLVADRSDRVCRLLGNLKERGCHLHAVPDEDVAALTDGRSIGAILGLVELPRDCDVAGILREPRASPAVALVAVDVEDPGNVGALVRTALASGAAVFAAVGVSDPFHPRAVRTSMGSLFKIAIARHDRVEPLLDSLAAIGALRLGAVSAAGRPPRATDLAGRPAAVFVGSEAFGLPDAVRARMDRLVTVPMAQGVDSLSVNAATAVLLYEFVGRSSRAAGEDRV